MPRNGGANQWSFQEVEIPTPFGFIRGKRWTNRPGGQSSSSFPLNGSTIGHGTSLENMIALHGWQDNCGTFDKLIPLLSPNHEMTIVAIDLPGHGLSSHLMPGSAYTDLTYATDIMRVLKYFEWEKVSLLGHSMGGYLSIYFASLFPDKVDRVITLDIVKPLTFKSDELSKSAAKSIESFLSIEGKIMDPTRKEVTYTWTSAVDRLLEGHAKIGKLTREGAEVLLKRGSRRVTYQNDDPNEDTEDDLQANYAFTRDPRLHAIFFSRLDITTVKAYLSNLKCKLYVVKAKDGIKLDDDDITKQFVDLYRRVCPEFRYILVDGDHHVHLCEAERVAPTVNAILNGDEIADNYPTPDTEDDNPSDKAILKVDDVVSN